MPPQDEIFWWVALAAGAAVIIVVIALMTPLLRVLRVLRVLRDVDGDAGAMRRAAAPPAAATPGARLESMAAAVDEVRDEIRRQREELIAR